jgi:hypothetical protein
VAQVHADDATSRPFGAAGPAQAFARDAATLPFGTAAEAQVPAGDPTVPRQRTRTSQVEIGAALVRRHRRMRGWLVALGMLVFAGAPTVTILVWSGRKEASAPTPPSPAPATPMTAKLRFQVEPRDAEIRLEGTAPHVGSPWSIELAAGAHAVEIRRGGYKSLLSSVELSAGETQLVRVELAPIGTAATAEATVSLTSTPLGLEALLDGHALSQRTPLKIQVKPGPHTIVVKQGGVEVWRHDLGAEANSVYELRARGNGTAPVPVPDPGAGDSGGSAAPAGSAAPPSPPPPPVPLAPSPPSPPSPPTPAPVPSTSPSPPTPAPTAQRPSAAPALASPMLVAPKAVTKLSGVTPNLRARVADLPPLIIAKLCIDTGGTVTSADVITKMDRDAAMTLASTLRTWRYAPYKLPTGLAARACFTVSFKINSTP